MDIGNVKSIQLFKLYAMKSIKEKGNHIQIKREFQIQFNGPSLRGFKLSKNYLLDIFETVTVKSNLQNSVNLEKYQDFKPVI